MNGDINYHIKLEMVADFSSPKGVYIYHGEKMAAFALSPRRINC